MANFLIVEDVRTFLCNWVNKNLDIFRYVCSERYTVGVKCRAKAIVWIYDVPGKGLKPFVEKVDRDHDCPTNIPKSIAEEMKHNMKELVRREPQKPVLDAIRAVRQQYADKYDNDEDFFEQIIAELGPDKAIEKQLLRVRAEIVGKNPLNRNMFDPNYFLRRVYGRDNGICTMDSNHLKTGWRENISKINPKSDYRWCRLNGNIRNQEGIENGEDEEENVTSEDVTEDEDGHYDENFIYDKPEYADLRGKDLPKRVLAFSSTKLLKLFGKQLKSSLDGTFKSSCFLWGQSFVWMVKFNGYWIPVVHAWLPDKKEESYKVITFPADTTFSLYIHMK